MLVAIKFLAIDTVTYQYSISWEYNSIELNYRFIAFSQSVQVFKHRVY